MDKFAYLGLNLALLSVWFLIFILRKDLRHKLIKASVLGGFCGLIAEVWYYTDYWRPPVVLGAGRFSLEDFLFGFTILGISVTIYDSIFRTKNDKTSSPFKFSMKNINNILRNWVKQKVLLLLFLGGIISLVVLNTFLKLPSILVSSLAFIAASFVILSYRKDLIKPSIVTGLLMVVVIIPIYIVLFNFLFSDFWKNYWLLNGTRLGIYVLGNIPWTELFWYFSLGTLIGGAYEFFKGYKKIPL